MINLHGIRPTGLPRRVVSARGGGYLSAPIATYHGCWSRGGACTQRDHPPALHPGVHASNPPKREDEGTSKEASITEAGPTRKPITLQGPQPRRYSVESTEHALQIVPKSLGSAARAYNGLFAEGYSFSIESNKPEGQFTSFEFGGRYLLEKGNPKSDKLKEPIQLYEFESCPYCKKVREACSTLSLDVAFFPCPTGGTAFRPTVKEMGGKQQFPYMIDPNQEGVAMYESDAIIEYVFNTYGAGHVPTLLRLGPVTALTAGLSTAVTQGSGGRVKPNKGPPPFPLELYGYEVSPFVKIVRDVLCELEIPYICHMTPRGSPVIQAFYEKYGRFQVPYIEDPNTGVGMFESTAIAQYLRDTYAA